MRTMFNEAILALAISCVPNLGVSQTVDLTVSGIRNANGNIIVILFDERHAFEGLHIERAAAFAAFPAATGQITHQLSGLDQGPFAIFLFHDENEDEDINSSGNRLLEGIGASGAHRFEDEPSFAEAAVAAGPVNVRVFYETE